MRRPHTTLPPPAVAVHCSVTCMEHCYLAPSKLLFGTTWSTYTCAVTIISEVGTGASAEYMVVWGCCCELLWCVTRPVMLLLLLLVLVTSPASADHSDVFSSTADLTRLLQLEARFITDLGNLADTLASEAAAIRQYLETHYPDGSPR